MWPLFYKLPVAWFAIFTIVGGVYRVLADIVNFMSAKSIRLLLLTVEACFASTCISLAVIRHITFNMVILKYSNELKEHIKTLNTEWLEQYFSVEENDIVQLSDPENEIIKKGGLIYYAAVDNIIAGTATLMKVDNCTYELAKMAVTKKYQGQGIGKKLVLHCIDVAKKIGAQKLILYSNRKLTPALELYKKYGFVEVAMDSTQYKRADIKMELILS